MDEQGYRCTPPSDSRSANRDRRKSVQLHRLSQRIVVSLGAGSGFPTHLRNCRQLARRPSHGQTVLFGIRVCAGGRKSLQPGATDGIPVPLVDFFPGRGNLFGLISEHPIRNSKLSEPTPILN